MIFFFYFSVLIEVCTLYKLSLKLDYITYITEK